ncbi:MAG: IS66 family insertion sequence element accessory protein TnpB [Proteobacteria bacterium]|nr:IS66 family insertion sequence element accessory protein TnpB [Pseudomonadota bacterium]
MRKQMDGLAAIVKDLDLDALSGTLYVFINRNRTKPKILTWEKNGFVIWYKRLEQHKFHWPSRIDGATVTLTGAQLNWLLDGYDVWRMRPHDELKFLFSG